MDFFTQQDTARKWTGFLVLSFLLATLLIVAAVCGVVAAGLSAYQGVPLSLSRDGGFLALAGLGTVALIGGGSLYRVASLAAGGRPVAEMLGGRLIDLHTQDLAERRALNVVEEMALASGCPVPPVYVMDHEDGINAFAAGHGMEDAVIGLTRGALDRLTRDELQGVLGHEFSHILNGDMKLDLRMMGVLFGILLIGMVGWTIFRSTSGTRVTVRDSDGREREGTNPLPLIGLGLYIVGYVGVFFARLIKSAVSRQREFLADASAVQFTRNPDGHANALKKIGALSQGSKVQATRAEEASHIFFGDALGIARWNPLATHPPLTERIRRLDPSFDGDFSRIAFTQTRAPEGFTAPSGEKLPRWVGAKMGQGQTPKPAQASARMAFNATAAVASIGRPTPKNLVTAATLVDAIPQPIAELTREPESARALVYALLLDRDDSQVRQQQIDTLSENWGPEPSQQIGLIAKQLDTLGPEVRLPLVELALPMLSRMSPEKFRSFLETLRLLMEADRRITLFEYALRRLLMRALGPQFGWYVPPRTTFRSVSQLTEPTRVVLSALAQLGTQNPEECQQSYQQGYIATTWGHLPAMLEASEATLKNVDEALNVLAGATPVLKQQFLLGCATCIGHDGTITIEEGQLLRAIADALDCPMPPVFQGGNSATPA